MGKIKVERLTISSGSNLATYDRKQSSEELFLEGTDELDVYKVTLREGTYGHTGDLGEEGAFEATLSIGGSLHGHVITQMPDRTLDGEPESITLILKAER